MTFEEIIRKAKEEGGDGLSDVFIRAGHHPILRVDGALRETDWGELSADDVESVCFGALSDADIEHFKRQKDIDLTVDVPDAGKVRLALLYECGRVSAVGRLIPKSIWSLDQLELPPAIAELTRLPNGLILVGGPTGSGKTTTLGAMLEQINAERACHIISLQSPLEMSFEEKKSIITLREIGRDAPTYAQAARYVLRQDPDVVHVGEMRDLETVQLSLVLAETGHLVLSNIHTHSAQETVNRIIDVFPEDQRDSIRRQLADTLAAVICQILLPRADRKGRAAINEILIVTPVVRRLIREGKQQIASVIQESRGEGMQTMAQAIADAKGRGIISEETAEATLAQHVDLS